jgi:hypothetical protein
MEIILHAITGAANTWSCSFAQLDYAP